MRGRAIPLSRPRRLINDLMHFSTGVPTVPVQRRMHLAAVVAAREASPDRPPWTAIFVKAFALVAEEFPELRRAYCKFPRPHLYEYPASVANVAVEREYHGERAVLARRIKDPARRPLAEIGEMIRAAASQPVDAVPEFRRSLALCAWPRPLRRALWWLGLNIGRQRANYFGTFGVTVYASLGAESLHPLSPLTTTLNYGVIADDGSVAVRLIYDHRVMDGATIARAMVRLERILVTQVCAELRQLHRPAVRAA